MEHFLKHELDPKLDEAVKEGELSKTGEKHLNHHVKQVELALKNDLKRAKANKHDDDKQHDDKAPYGRSKGYDWRYKYGGKMDAYAARKKHMMEHEKRMEEAKKKHHKHRKDDQDKHNKHDFSGRLEVEVKNGEIRINGHVYDMDMFPEKLREIFSKHAMNFQDQREAYEEKMKELKSGYEKRMRKIREDMSKRMNELHQAREKRFQDFQKKYKGKSHQFERKESRRKHKRDGKDD